MFIILRDARNANPGAILWTAVDPPTLVRKLEPNARKQRQQQQQQWWWQQQHWNLTMDNSSEWKLKKTNIGINFKVNLAK